MLMKIVDKIKKIVVEPCLEEDESYSVRSRKFIVIAVAIICSNALLLGIPVTLIAGYVDPSVGMYIVAGALLHLTIASSAIPYTYLRITKKLPDWLVDFQVWSTVPTTLCLSLFTHQGSVAIACTCAILIAVVLRVRGWPIMLMYGLATNVLHALINDFGDALPALHDTFYHSQVLSVRIIHLFGVNMSPVLFFGLGLYGIMKEFVERSDQADAAIAMNLAVADKLRRYDTDSVAVILAANKGKVDENLLEAFTAIQHNLQEYRPHIPDYVIAATTSTEEDDIGSDAEEQDEGLIEEDEQISLLSSQDCSVRMGSIAGGKDSDKASSSHIHRNNTNITRNRSNSRHKNNSNNIPSGNLGGVLVVVGSDDEVLSNRSSNKSGSRFGFSRSPRPPHLGGSKDSLNSSTDPSITTGTTTCTTAAPATVGVHRKQHNNNNNNNGGGKGGRHSAPNTSATNDEMAAIKQRQHYYGKVTTVFVRFVSEACGSDGSGSGSVPKSSNVAAMMALSRCVEAASKLAKLFHGALQYMQGCGLMVSFNATSRVATHEAKACAFADALRLEVDGMRSTSPVVMHASVVTSPNVLSFFAGNSGQLMLTVLGGFMPQHTAMHHYLSQTVGMVASCVLLSDTVVSTIELFYETRRLGAITMVNAREDTSLSFSQVESTRRNSVVLSQLLGQRHNTGNDEWMYNMQSASATDATTTITNCLVDVAIEGGTPPQIPDNVVAMTTSDIVLERCVVSRLQACHDSKGSQQFTIHTAPTVMW